MLHRTLLRFTLTVTICFSASSVTLAQTDQATDTKSTPATTSTAPAEKTTENADLPAGHSQHGEAFNEGPRQKAYLMPGTGKVSFPVTTENPSAKKFVEQGIGQLHGFWYFEAERSFRQAAMLDPDCAMAYWGMAMANRNNSKRAKGFLTEAVKRKENSSRLESLFIDALNDYVNGTEKRKEKAQKHVAAFENIVKEFPENIEARAFLAYALYKHRSDLKREYEDVEKAIQDVLAKAPMHSAHHYRIHLWDHKEPAKVLDSAAVCGEASAGIAHMWHMPGHIYSRLKRYNDAVWQQEASARVDHAHMMRDRVMPDQIHNFAHNNEWLIRNLNYTGQWRDGIELAKNMISLPRHPKYNTLTRRGSTYYGRLRLFEVLNRFEMWEELIALCQQSYLEPTDRESDQLKRLRYLGIAYARSGDLEKSGEILIDLEKRLKVADEKAKKAAAAKKAADEKAAKAKAEQEKKAAEAKAAKEKAEQAKKAAEAKSAEKNEEKSKPADSKPADEKAKTTPAKKPTPAKAKPKTPDPTVNFKKAVAAVKGHMAVENGDYKAALDLLKTAGEDALYQARIQFLTDEKDKAITAAANYVKSRANQTQPLAGEIEILWMAEKKEEAKKKFEELRKISSSIQFGTPVFDRLQPIAKELGFPSDWRLSKPHPDDFGERPELDTLGPIHWQPSPAPDWTLKDTTGKEFRLEQFRGKPVVVIFYLGYGCLHCAEQLQAFAPMAKQYKDAGISLIAISTDNQEDLKKSIDDYSGGMPFPLVSNEKLDIFKAYRAFDDFENSTLHGTYLIDSNGRVLWQDISYEPFMDPKFLLAESQRLLAQKKNNSGKNEIAVNSVPTESVAPSKTVQPKPLDSAPEIRASGIDGSLILSGHGKVSEAAINNFLNLAKRKQSKIVILRVPGKNNETALDESLKLFDKWNSENGISFKIHQLGMGSKVLDSDIQNDLNSATGVWLAGGTRKSFNDAFADKSLTNHLQQFLKRGGVLGGSAEFSSTVSDGVFTDEKTHAATNSATQYLPGTILEILKTDDAKSNRLQQALTINPGFVGLQLANNSTLIVRGRRLLSVGNGPVEINFAKANGYPAKSITLDDSRRFEDFTAMRRYALQHTQPIFPPLKPASPTVDSGTLMIVGGGLPAGSFEKFVNLAGGEEASIVIIPIALPDPLPEKNRTAEIFRQTGAREVTVLTGRTPQAVDQPESLAALRKATGIWFGGGRQWRFMDAYDGTTAAQLMHDVLKRGGVIGGSSAGASIQGEYMARGNPTGNRDIMAIGYERGLGFLPGVAIDQHFTQRNRLRDLSSLVDRYPQLLGIGIDEATAIIVKGNIAEVIGNNRVCFYDRNKSVVKGKPDFESVAAGGRYDLVTRTVLDPGGKKEAKPTAKTNSATSVP